MVSSFFPTKAASLAVLFACAQPTVAGSDFVTPFDPDALWPAPLEIESSLDGLGIDIKGIDMSMTVQDAHAAAGGDVQDTSWRFADRHRLSKDKLIKEDVSTLRVTFERQKGYEDYAIIQSSRWHTGNQIVRMTRYVTIDDPARQPLEDTFLNAIASKYGDYDDGPYMETRVAGLGGTFFRGYLWTWDAGERSLFCEGYQLPNQLRDVYKNSLERLQAFADDIQTPEACDVVMEVFHDKTPAGTIKHYKIVITDIRMLFLDALNDRQVREHLQLYLENSLQADNTNAPDL